MFALALAVFIPLLVYAGAPSWWAQRGVLISGANADDYAPANQGQLKNIAKAAMAEMDARLPGGAGQAVHDLVDSWSSPTPQTDDFAPVNLGQLKTVAKPFYDRLISVGLVADYPWAGASAPANDFAVANLGQVKKLFSFEPGQIDPLFDGDGNGLPDSWERQYFGGTGADPNADPDGDGLTTLQEYQQGSDPSDYYNSVTPIIVIVSGDNQQSSAGALAPLPLVVRVMDGQGIPLVNAPVRFTVQEGGGSLAATPQAPPASTQEIRTTADATAAVFYRQPVAPHVTGRIIASAGPHDYPTTTVFTALSQANPPIPMRGFTATPPEVAAVLNPGSSTNVPLVIRNDTDESQQVTVAVELPTFPSYTDSRQPNGPAFVWNDISGTGTHLSALSNHDISFQPLEIGFNFPFFGDTYHTVYVSAHGYVTFGSGSSTFQSSQMPGTHMPANIVAGYSTLMSLRISGDVYVKEELDRVTIQYTNAYCHFQGGFATFQIVLQHDGTILFYYKDMLGPMNDGTIGIQNGTRDVGLTVASRSEYVTSNLAVRITDAKHHHVATAAPPGSVYNGSYADSDQPGGPAYVWNDISATGTRLNYISDGDDRSESFNISFPFPFFEKNYQTVWVSSNGSVTFGSGSSGAGNFRLPTYFYEIPIIAGLSSDLDPGASGDIYYEEKPDKIIIQFNNVARYGGDGSATFQIVLQPDGGIILYYKELTGDAYLATVGLQGSPQAGMTVAYNEPYLKNNLAVRLDQLTQWLTVSPQTATLAPGASTTINASLDARFIQTGSYEGKIHIASPVTPDVGVDVPVSLRVNTAPDVYLTSPSWWESFVEGQPVTLAAEAQDSDGIARVEFLEGTTKLGEATVAPFSIPTTNLAPGVHWITSRAFDSYGLSRTSDPVALEIEADADRDGMTDSWETSYFGNLAQGPNEDPDQDGLTNLTEFREGFDPTWRDDSDEDGLPDGYEENVYHTDRWNSDTDGDGMPDGYEVAHDLDPLSDDRHADPDGDGLTNGEELSLGTNPRMFSTVDDGISDGWKVGYGLDPLDPTLADQVLGSGQTIRDAYTSGGDPRNWDANGDGVPDSISPSLEIDPLNVDQDGDGIANAVELVAGTNPFKADTDGDGVPDGADAFPLDPARSQLPIDPNDTTAPGITLIEPVGATPVP